MSNLCKLTKEYLHPQETLEAAFFLNLKDLVQDNYFKLYFNKCKYLKGHCHKIFSSVFFMNQFHPSPRLSHYIYGNDIETKANESFDNGVFFNIKAKRTPSIVRKLFLKPCSIVRKLFSKRSEHIR